MESLSTIQLQVSLNKKANILTEILPCNTKTSAGCAAIRQYVNFHQSRDHESEGVARIFRNALNPKPYGAVNYQSSEKAYKKLITVGINDR